jgi:hypothetical protein
VVSPYAKANYVSHVTHDFGSILSLFKFVGELRAAVPGLRKCPADDFSDCFNFNQTPLAFQTIQAPLKADYFLNDHRPPEGSDND